MEKMRILFRSILTILLTTCLIPLLANEESYWAKLQAWLGFGTKIAEQSQIKKPLESEPNEPSEEERRAQAKKFKEHFKATYLEEKGKPTKEITKIVLLNTSNQIEKEFPVNESIDESLVNEFFGFNPENIFSIGEYVIVEHNFSYWLGPVVDVLPNKRVFVSIELPNVGKFLTAGAVEQIGKLKPDYTIKIKKEETE